MSDYKLTRNGGVIRLRDNASIPDAVGNTDWDEYLVWKDAGGVPDPVDQPSARDLALTEIDRLERSITDRMWREDAVGSTSVMAFGADDPRTGKTATQYIGWVNSAIANIRAGL